MSLSPAAKDLWAKKEVNSHGRELWLPLITHLIDTAHTMSWLYAHWLNSSQRQLIQDDLSDQQVHQILRVLGFFHDFGKATPAFQTKDSYGGHDTIDENLLKRLINAGFTNIDALRQQLSDPQASSHPKAGEALLESYGLNQTLGAIIGAHHGQPLDADPDENISDYTSNYNGNQPQIWHQARQEILDCGLKQANLDSLANLPEVNEIQAILLTGLLIMADWLSSTEYLKISNQKQAEYLPLFPLVSIDISFDDINPYERFRHAVSTWDVDSHWQPKPITFIRQRFQARFGFQPRAVQELMLKQIMNIQDPGMIIIEASCGSGKTETSLVASEQLGATTQHNGLFFALPTQATSNSMFTRIDDWLNQIVDNNPTTTPTHLPLNLMHSKAKLNQEATSLPVTRNIAGQSAVVTNSWFTGKKSILVEFTVATIDHLLSMGLKQKHLFLSHLAFSGKVVIIDEVHAYDTYMNSYLKQVLRWLGAYHVPVIALSATLPYQKRNELIKAYYLGKYKKRVHPKNLAKDAYPLLTYTDGSSIKQFKDFPKESPKQVQVTRLDADLDALVDKIQASLVHGGVAGVIVNTVKQSQAIAQALAKHDVPIMLLHSGFIDTDRADKEKALIKKIGSQKQRPDKLAVIGTQVLSQSLDIDFDVLFSDMAPMDALIQRLGRLHRHNIQRPQGLENPHLYVFNAKVYSNYGKYNNYIYEQYYLLKTDHFLPKVITLPADGSRLVQLVYGPETDPQVPDIQDAKIQLENKLAKKEDKADNFQIDYPYNKSKSRFYEPIFGWLSHKQKDNSEAGIKRSVRDIQDTIEVIALQENTDGTYSTVSNHPKPISTLSNQELAEETLRLPHALSFNFDQTQATIDELQTATNKRFPGWKNDPYLYHGLALVFNSQGQAKLNQYRLSYSHQYGLIYEKQL